MINKRRLDQIEADINLAKNSKQRLGFTPEQTAIDMLVVLEALEKDLIKYISKDMDAPAKRARKNTKLLEILSKHFRVQSVKVTKDGTPKH